MFWEEWRTRDISGEALPKSWKLGSCSLKVSYLTVRPRHTSSTTIVSAHVRCVEISNVCIKPAATRCFVTINQYKSCHFGSRIPHFQTHCNPKQQLLPPLGPVDVWKTWASKTFPGFRKGTFPWQFLSGTFLWQILFALEKQFLGSCANFLVTTVQINTRTKWKHWPPKQNHWLLSWENFQVISHKDDGREQLYKTMGVDILG